MQPVPGTTGLKKKGKAKQKIQNPRTNSSVVGASGRILEDLRLTQNLFLTQTKPKICLVWFTVILTATNICLQHTQTCPKMSLLMIGEVLEGKQGQRHQNLREHLSDKRES